VVSATFPGVSSGDSAPQDQLAVLATTTFGKRKQDPECKMENEHKYRVVAWWTSGQTGIANSESAPNAIHFTAPPQFGGLEGRWTPKTY
jgi:hypothetical protein